MNDQTEVHIFLVFENGFSVSKSLYESVKRQVDEVLPILKTEREYKLETLCGDDFWNSLSDGEKRLAGRCMTHMVDHKLLPIRYADYSCRTPKRYRLK